MPRDESKLKIACSVLLHRRRYRLRELYRSVSESTLCDQPHPAINDATPGPFEELNVSSFVLDLLELYLSAEPNQPRIKFVDSGFQIFKCLVEPTCGNIRIEKEHRLDVLGSGP